MTWVKKERKKETNEEDKQTNKASVCDIERNCDREERWNLINIRMQYILLIPQISCGLERYNDAHHT